MTRFPLSILLFILAAILPSCQSAADRIARETEEMTYAKLQLETAQNDYNKNPHDEGAMRRVAIWSGKIAALESLALPSQVYVEKGVMRVIDSSTTAEKRE